MLSKKPVRPASQSNYAPKSKSVTSSISHVRPAFSARPASFLHPVRPAFSNARAVFQNSNTRAASLRLRLKPAATARPTSRTLSTMPTSRVATQGHSNRHLG